MNKIIMNSGGDTYVVRSKVVGFEVKSARLWILVAGAGDEPNRVPFEVTNDLPHLQSLVNRFQLLFEEGGE